MTAQSSAEKWPASFKVVRVTDSCIGKELVLFFLTGVVNSRQRDQVSNVIDVLAEQEIDPDRLVISTLLNQEQLEELDRVFAPRAKAWRGQYYSLANAIVDACQEALKT